MRNISTAGKEQSIIAGQEVKIPLQKNLSVLGLQLFHIIITFSFTSDKCSSYYSFLFGPFAVLVVSCFV